MSEFRVPQHLDEDLFADLLAELSSDYESGDVVLTGGNLEISLNAEHPTDYTFEVEFNLTSDSNFEEELSRLVDPDGE